MIKELGLSACVMAVIIALFAAATEASTFTAQVWLSGISVALSYYYVTNHNYCLAMDSALVKKSLLVGVVAAIPMASLMIPAIQH